jgi:hypothetical protein
MKPMPELWQLVKVWVRLQPCWPLFGQLTAYVGTNALAWTIVDRA